MLASEQLVLDSTGKLPSGLLLGSLTWPGNFRQCKSVHVPMDISGQGDFHGQYCVASWEVESSSNGSKLPINIGLCVPDTCQNEDISEPVITLMRIAGYLPFLRKYASALKLSSVSCKIGAEPPDAITIAFICLICLLILLVLLASAATGYKYFMAKRMPTPVSSTPLSKDAESGCKSIQTTAATFEVSSELKKKLDSSSHSEVILRQDNVISQNIFAADVGKYKRMNPPKRISAIDILHCFCAFSNGMKIFNVEASQFQLSSLYGIRVLSMTWVILGHTYITSAAYVGNKLEVLSDIDSFPFQMVLQAPFSVDAFFLLSGLLLANIFLKEADKRNGKVNWLYFYLHRLWRLTPVYMLLVGFYMLLFKYMGSGPFWDEKHGDSCRHTWWWYLLYINNFIPIKQMCIGWSWYLANDMQFYIISPLYLYSLWRWPKIGVMSVLCLLLGSWVVSGILTSTHDIIPFLSEVTADTNLLEYENRMWNSFNQIYDKPYCRVGPHLVGVLLGFLLYKTAKQNYMLSSWKVYFGWISATFFAASVIFGLYHIHISSGISIAYNAFSRTSFAIGLAWLIFACEMGHGGIVHKFLSMKFWIPLSRLTFCAYLVHPLLIHGYYYGLQSMLYFTHSVMVLYFLAFVILSYTLAFVVSLMFESPMLNIEKLLLKPSN